MKNQQIKIKIQALWPSSPTIEFTTDRFKRNNETNEAAILSRRLFTCFW